MGRGGLASLILVSFFEASLFPIPPDTLLVPMSILKPRRALLYALLATAFSSAGALFGHWLGQIGGRPLLERIASKESICRTEQLLGRYSGWAVAIAGFTPIPFKLATIASGIFRVPKLTLLVASFFSRGVRFGTEAVIILLLGPAAAEFLDRYLPLLSVAVVLICAGVLLLGRGEGVQSCYKKTSIYLKNILSPFVKKITSLTTRPLFSLWLTLALIFSFGFLEIGESIGLPWQVSFDKQVTALVQGGLVGNLYYPITNLGSSWFLICLLAIAGSYFLWRKKGNVALALGLDSLGAFLANRVLKSIYARPRPAAPLLVEPGYSYPSGHAMIGIVFYLSLAWALSRDWGRGWRAVLLALGAILAFFIGSSRIYLGVHYPTDVVGGFVAGLAWLCLGRIVRLSLD